MNDLDDKLKEYAELNLFIQKLKPFMEKDKIVVWLGTPNKVLDNKIPFDIIMEGNIVELNKKIYEAGEEVFQ
jgi:hypothetical protein